MNHQDYAKAIDHWKNADAASQKPGKDAILRSIEEYIGANNTGALATGSGSWVRNTPIEYSYHEGAFWMFSEGGEKFIGLETNKNVSIAIFDFYTGFSTIKGLQIQGVAELIEPFSDIYIAAAEFKKIPVKALRELPEPMNLIKVTPVRMNYLNSDFKKEGYGSRQEWTP